MTSRVARWLQSFVSAGVVVGLTGCGALHPGTDIGFAPPADAATISGVAHGGPQAITGATVQLYTSGAVAAPATNTQFSLNYGQGAVLRATSAPTSSNGAFSFTKSATNSDTITSTTPNWACPTTGDPIVYLVATGGNPTGNGLATPVNNSIKLMAVLGRCSQVSTSTRIFLNEITTVASVAAMQQFLNPNYTFNSTTYPSLGGTTSALSVKGMRDAADTVNNLIDIRTGSARAITKTAVTGTNVTGISVTITPEIAKINTLANIIAACVQSTGSASTDPCPVLMANAVPPTAANTSQPTGTFNAPTDTLTALYYMLTNPTSGAAASPTSDSTALGNLYALQTSTAPFGPALTQKPTDWTVGVRYEANGQTCGLGSNGLPQKFLGYAYHLSVDSNGDLYAVNGTLTPASGGTVTGGLTQISATGLPLACAATGIGASPASGASGGSTGPALSYGSVAPDGNVWLSSLGTTAAPQLYRYNPTSTTVDTFPATASTLIYSNVIDGSNNVYYAVSNQIYKIPSAYLITGTAPYGIPITSGSNSIATTPAFLAIDGGGSLFNGYQSTNTASFDVLFQTYPSSTTSVSGTYGSDAAGYYRTVRNQMTGVTLSNANAPNNFGLAVGINGKVWAANGNCTSCSNQNTFAAYQPSASATTGGGTITAGSTTDYAPGVGGLADARGVAIDGAGNVWSVTSGGAYGSYATGATYATCKLTSVNSDTCWSIVELGYDGSPLSATGTAVNGGASGVATTSNGGFQKLPSVLPFYGRSLAVTAAGNLWIGSNSPGGTGVTELVGAAVPVVTPLSAAQAAYSTNGGNIVPKP